MSGGPVNSGYARMMLVATAPKLHGCPRCGAARGEWCRSRGGYQNSTVGFHAARRALVADLPDDEAYALMVGLLDEDEARREAAKAALARPMSPAAAASRARTGAAWDRIGAEVSAEMRQPAKVVPLAPFRGGDLVSLDAARERRARRGVPSLPGGAA